VWHHFYTLLFEEISDLIKGIMIRELSSDYVMNKLLECVKFTYAGINFAENHERLISVFSIFNILIQNI
jgi:hypothetical protein